MDLDKKYTDLSGNDRNILEMVKMYPEWAANVIQQYEERVEVLIKSNTVSTNGPTRLP